MAARSSTLAWLATGLLVSTAPFVAKAQLGDDATLQHEPASAQNAGVPPPATVAPPEDDAGLIADAALGEGGDSMGAPGPLLPDGGPTSRIPGGGDTGGWSCDAAPTSSGGTGACAAMTLVGVAITARRRCERRGAR